MKISILDDYLNTIRRLPAFSKIEHHSVKIWNDHTKDEDALVERLRDTEILVTIRERTPLSGSLLRRLPKLRLISCRGDTPHIDVATCTELGILICADQHADAPNHATAELVWGLMITTLRRIPQQMASLKAGRWHTEVGLGLHGRTLGIFGYGKIGKALAGYGRAFGMNVLIWAREKSRAQAVADGYEAAASKQQFFETSDVLTLQMRLRDETRGIVTGADLALMKPTALFVNTSRAGLVAPGALVEALRKDRPGFAALDVYESEPMTDPSNPLLQLDNVTCTPHIGFVEFWSMNNSFGSIFDQIKAFESSAPINVVNASALTRLRKA